LDDTQRGPGRGGREGVPKPRGGPGWSGRGEVPKPRGGHQKDAGDQVVEEPRGGPKRGRRGVRSPRGGPGGHRAMIPRPAAAWWPSQRTLYSDVKVVLLLKLHVGCSIELSTDVFHV
jgi:hypothetical protein